MAYSLTREFVLLCEGEIDKTFFDNLLAQRKIKNIDVPPHKVDETPAHRGVQALGRFLKAVSGDAAWYSKLRGVLIIADSGDDATRTFNAVCRKLAKDGPFTKAAPFVKPSGPYAMATQPAGHPPIVVMTIPKATPGALETLCIEAILNKRPQLEECLATYHACEGLKTLSWHAEKREKARLQCLTASLNEKDPNRPLRHTLEKKPVIISMKSKAFTPLVTAIKKFCASV